MCSSDRKDLQFNQYRVTIEEKERAIYMWLWKKFWNTDIIGKIYILIILFIIVVATMTVITRSKKARVKETTRNIVQKELSLNFF